MASTCTTELCNRVLELMKKGKTQQEVCAEVGVAPCTFIEWRNPKSPQYEPEFAAMFERAKLFQFAWWEKKGRCNLKVKDFNITLYALFMANMFGWRGSSSKDDQAMEEIREISDGHRQVPIGGSEFYHSDRSEGVRYESCP
jgi:hypothetical protein